MTHTVQPRFEQSIDAARPHTLLTENPKFSGMLDYRYDDSAEVVRVPNIWYNQTYTTRVAALRWDAERRQEKLNKCQSNPPYYISAQGVADMVRREGAVITQLRAQADAIERAGREDYPVRASRL